jgi:hypothetical protein
VPLNEHFEQEYHRGSSSTTKLLPPSLQLKLIKACSTDELVALGLQAPAPPAPASMLNDSQQPVAARLQAVQVRPVTMHMTYTCCGAGHVSQCQTLATLQAPRCWQSQVLGVLQSLRTVFHFTSQPLAVIAEGVVFAPSRKWLPSAAASDTAVGRHQLPAV